MLHGTLKVVIELGSFIVFIFIQYLTMKLKKIINISIINMVNFFFWIVTFIVSLHYKWYIYATILILQMILGLYLNFKKDSDKRKIVDAIVGIAVKRQEGPGDPTDSE